jgi:hypothetical protein
VRSEELTSDVCAVDFEPLVGAGELLEQAEVVKHGGNIQEFGIECEHSLTALLGPEEIYADGVIEEQIRRMLTQKIRGLSRDQRIGNGENGG